MVTPRVFEFGPFRLDTGRRLLLREGRPVALKPKAFELLLVLVENADRVMEKEELMRRLWPDSVVEENNLTVHKRALVAALGAGYIQAVPRRGYRFVAPVREVSGEEDAPERKPSAASPTLVTDDATVTSQSHSPAPGLLSENEVPTAASVAPQKRLWLIAAVALSVSAGAALIWFTAGRRTGHASGEHVPIRAPAEEAEVMRVVKESQIFETLKIYTHPETFDPSQLNSYWLPAEQGGKAVKEVEAAVARLRQRGWRYADESRLEIFDFRYARVFSGGDYAEVGTSERWFVPTVRAADGSRVENKNVYLGTYDVDYTLRKVSDRWLLESNSTPRPQSNGNRNS